MYRKLLAAFVGVLLAVPGGVFAQTGTIAGTVVDSTTSETLPGVNVVVEGVGAGAATGANGEFEISGVPVGQQTVRFSFVGYRAKTRTVNVSAGSTTRLQVGLIAEAVGLEDVVVTALGEERTERSVGTSVQQIGGDDLAEVDQENFISSLEGRVSGVDIRTSRS